MGAGRERKTGSHVSSTRSGLEPFPGEPIPPGMAPRDDRPARTGNPGVLLAVLAAAAIVAGGLFWELNRQTSSPEAAGVGPLGLNPAKGAPPAQTRNTP